MKLKLFVLSLFFTFLHTQAQVNSTITLENQILDAVTKQPLPYAQVLIVALKKGTITNTEGYFKINSLHTNDMLRISFIGYENLIITAQAAANTNVILLKPKTEILNAVTIVSDASFLYDLILKSKKTQNNKMASARTYLELETEINNQPIELLEAYYNGDFRNYDVKDLNLKSGRVFIKPMDSIYFLSTETSKAIYSHNQYDKNPYFPYSPFELNAKKLKKTYKLKLLKRYYDEDNSLIYVIYFQPKNNPKTAFEGTVWIDSSSTHLRKVEFEIKNAITYPLKTIHANDSIQQMDLTIRKSFTNIDGKSYVKSLDFDYQLTYKRTSTEPFTVKSKAVLFAYDFDSLFVLPKFDFPDIVYQDYHHIFSVPYNDFFWENVSDFNYKFQTDLRASFTNDKTLLSNKYRGILIQPLIAHQFINWSEIRVDFSAIGQKYIGNNYSNYADDQYQIELQHYLDYNTFNDSLSFQTATILDPVNSFYNLPINATAKAFLNIFFDCMEIERRIMDVRLSLCTTEDELEKAYESELSRIDGSSKKILSQLKHGFNKDAMLFYNRYVFENLGVDNLAFFNVYPD